MPARLAPGCRARTGPPACHRQAQLGAWPRPHSQPLALDPWRRWHVWYLFALMILIAAFLAMGWVHKWRVGLIGLTIPLLVLLQYTW